MTVSFSPDHVGTLIVEYPQATTTITGVTLRDAETVITGLAANKSARIVTVEGELWAVDAIKYLTARWRATVNPNTGGTTR